MNNVHSYEMLLRESAEESGSVLCLGIDPVIEALPQEFNPKAHMEPGGSVYNGLEEFFFIYFESLVQHNLRPAACKVNIGFFHALDRPRENCFAGSRALAAVLDMIEDFFAEIPIILDSKRGDIQRSSENYAVEAFTAWQCDAVTVSPYMGNDSLRPFFRMGKGVYVLNRTSNPGSRDIQDLNTDLGKLYIRTAQHIIRWHEEYAGVGAVVGATFTEELRSLVTEYAHHKIPLLIPGVGSQGGGAAEVMDVLKSSGYDMPLVRINSSSALTFPWKNKPAPDNWLGVCIDAFTALHREVSID